MIKRFFPFFLKASISIGLLIYLFALVDFAAITEVLFRTDLFYIILLFCVSITGLVLSAYKWQALLMIDGVRISVLDLTRYYLIGIYFNNFLPTSIGGDGVRAFMVAKHNGKLMSAVTSVFAERLSGLIALVLLGIIGFLLNPGIFHIKVAYLVFAGMLVSLFFLLALINNHLRVLICKWLPVRLQNHIVDFGRALAGYIADRKTVWTVVWTSILFQFLTIAVYYLAARSFGLYISFLDLMVVVPLVTILTLIPFSLNGLGIREGGFVFFLSRLGIAKYEALSLSLLVYGLSLLLSLMGWVIFWSMNNDKMKLLLRYK